MVESVNVIKSERCDQDEADGDHQLQDGDVDGDVEWDGERERDGDVKMGITPVGVRRVGLLVKASGSRW